MRAFPMRSHPPSGDPAGSVTIEWHRRWSPAIDSAFAAMPYDPLMDGDYVRRLWFHSAGHGAQQSRESALTLTEDRFDDLPVAVRHWAAVWRSRGSPETAAREHDLLASYRILAEQGRLKTFSLHQGRTFAGMAISMIAPPTLYALMLSVNDEFRSAYPGIFLTLITLEWACANRFGECDLLRTSGDLKGQWAAPSIRGYHFVRGPLNSYALARAGDRARRYHNGVVRRAIRLPHTTGRLLRDLDHRRP